MDAELNPYRPGAGHSPPYLAGRDEEVEKFSVFLRQDDILKNVILTGLRGVGKTVLMDDKFKPLAQSQQWVWVGSDLSEASFLNEQNLCLRLITDLSAFSSSLSASAPSTAIGFDAKAHETRSLDFDFLITLFEAQPGLMVDKLKAVLELVWAAAKKRAIKGIIFAYDEAQVAADQKQKEQFPLAILLEAFQSIQRKGARYMLLLTGLPTLYAKLVESRTYAERMFSVQEIGRLSETASREAIVVPLASHNWKFTDAGIKTILDSSDGYPYFIQFICRETFDFMRFNPKSKAIPVDAIIRKLDSDFFNARWEPLTDRQRDMLYCIAQIESSDAEFTIPAAVEASTKTPRHIKPFLRGDVSQILPRLIDKGLIYRNRYGKYSFAVPLFGKFVQRKYETPASQRMLFD